MVLISSLYPVRDARSWPDKVHDAWLALGLALAGLAWCLAVPRGASRPLAWPWLTLGLALGLALWLAVGLALGWPLAWPLVGPWPGPWLALGLAMVGPWLGP